MGTTAANAFGLHNMHGNVAEWVNDWWSTTYYANSPPVDPPGPSFACGYHVWRGGTWRDMADAGRSARRNWWSPVAFDNTLGARLAMDVYIFTDDFESGDVTAWSLVVP